MDPKSHILNAAQAVFARHGFRQTSMAMVAEEADLSRQALYHHFASKEALFAALVDALQEAALAGAKAAMRKPASTAAETLFAVKHAYHEHLVSGLSGSVYVTELIEEGGRLCGPAVSAHAKRFEKELEALCVRMIEEGLLSLRPGVTPRDLVEMIVTAARGVKAVHAGDSPARYSRALQRIIATICAGVEAAPGSRRASVKLVQRVETGRRRIAR
jgi:AcrR family transcriptional regulator